MSDNNLLFNPQDKEDGRPLVEIIAARLADPLRAQDKVGYRLYAIEDWVYAVSGSKEEDRSSPWRELKERMTETHSIEGWIYIENGAFRGKNNSIVTLDACDELGLYYIFQFVDQGITNNTIKSVRRYLAAAGVALDKLRRDPVKPEDAIDYAIEEYRRAGKDELWIQNRLQSKIARKQFEYALKLAILSIQPIHYAIATNKLYVGLLGRTAEVLRHQMNLSEKDNLRDNLSGIVLLFIAMAETLCAEKLPKEDQIKFKVAANIVFDVAQFISNQVKQTETWLGRDLIMGNEKLPDEHYYHDMIDELGQNVINEDGFYPDDIKELLDKNE